MLSWLKEYEIFIHSIIFTKTQYNIEVKLRAKYLKIVLNVGI